MKYRNKAVLLISALLIILFSILAFADGSEYTGTVDGVTELIEGFDRSNSTKNKLNALDKAIAYVATVDPDSDGISEIYAEIDIRILDLAKIYQSEMDLLDTFGEKHIARDNLEAYLLSHPFYGNVPSAEEFYDALYGATVAIADGYLAELSTLESAPEKHTVIDNLDALIEKYSIECADSFMTTLYGETFLTASLYIDELSGLASVAERGAYVRLIDVFLSDHDMGEPTEETTGLVFAFGELKAQYEYDMEAARQSLNNLAHLKDLVAPIRVDRTFDGNGTGVLTPMGNMNGNEVISFVGEDHGMDGDNKYYTVSFDAQKKHVRTSLDLTSVTDSVVIDFDITTFDSLPNTCIWVEDVGRTNGATWSIMYFSVTPNGDIATDAGGKEIILKNAITPGKWTHISLVIEHSTADVDLYVDYELVYETNKSHPTHGYTYSPETLIMGANPSAAGSSFSLDNVKVYGGHSPRDIYWFNGAAHEDMFVYYVSAIVNEDHTPRARKEYYDEAKRNLSTYYKDGEYLTENQSVIEAVDKLLSFDYEALLIELSDTNLKRYEEIYNRLKSISLGESTVSIRSYWLSSADSFLGSTGGNITSGEVYNNIAAFISEMRYLIDIENLIIEFTAHVDAFYSASTVSLKETSCESALALMDFIDETVIRDKSLYPNYFNALDRAVQMETILYETVCIDNSKKLLAIVSYVMASNSTEQSWNDNYDKLKGYVSQARAIINEGKFDVYYKGLNKILEDFAPMSEYFFARLQETHIRHFEEEFLKYDLSEQYFEKYGILVKLKDYVQNNEVDIEDETIAALIKRVDEELILMQGREDEYEALLKENTVKFVDICSGLVGSVDYRTMKELVSEASVYYYTMSVDIASVQDAIAVYKLRRDEIKAKESYANEFIMLSRTINVESDDALALIIDCAAYLDHVERCVDGVDSAITLFEEKKADYDARVAGVNREVVETVLVSAYQRNYSDMGSFISLIVDVAIGSEVLRGDFD